MHFDIMYCVFKKAIAIHPNFSTTSNRIYVCGGKEVCNIVLENCTTVIIIAIAVYDRREAMANRE